MPADQMLGFTTFFLVAAVIFISVLAWAIPVRLWIEAISAGVRVGIGYLVGMRLRKVSPPAVVRPLIWANKAGLDLYIAEDSEIIHPSYGLLDIIGGEFRTAIDGGYSHYEGGSGDLVALKRDFDNSVGRFLCLPGNSQGHHDGEKQ